MEGSEREWRARLMIQVLKDEYFGRHIFLAKIKRSLSLRATIA
jgi:hypothetical protein